MLYNDNGFNIYLTKLNSNLVLLKLIGGVK